MMSVLLLGAAIVAGASRSPVCSLSHGESGQVESVTKQDFEVSIRGGFSQRSVPFRTVVDSSGSGYNEILLPNCQWGRRGLTLTPAETEYIRRLVLAATSSPLKDRYAAAGTDGQVIEFDLRVQGKEYRVFDYGGASAGLPESLVKLEAKLISLGQRARR